MWPWDHLAVGYLVVSVWRRIRSRRPPSGAEAAAVLFGTQLPDLVDKPLAWGTTLIPAGKSMAHSLPVAVPVSLGAYLLARRYGREDVGVAFALGYLSHLPGDVVYPMVLGRSPDVLFLFWPFLEVPESHPDAITGHLVHLLAVFVEFAQTPAGQLFLLSEAALLGVTLALWWRDGWPGLGVLRRTPGA